MNYLNNIINSLTPWWTTVTILAYLIGISLFVVSAHSALNNAREKTSNNYIWLFFASVLCLNLPAFLNSISVTIFNNGSVNNILAYTSNVKNGAGYITFAIRAVMIIGLVGVIYGINLLRDTAQRAKDIPKAMSHLIGGTLAVNIVQFLQMIGATAGGDVKSYIEFIF